MHCPSCGQAATANQQFCRHCGMRLETIGKLVAVHTGESFPTGENAADKAETEKLILGRMFRFLSWGILVLGVGMIMLAVNKSFGFGEWFRFVATFFMICGTALTTYGVLKAIRDGIAISGKTSPKSIESREFNSLPTERIPVAPPSITERTTQLIAGEPAPTHREEDD